MGGDGGVMHIVNVSGGAASGLCLIRVCEQFGVGNVVARFADVQYEATDVYDFLAELERYCGIHIIRLSQGKDTWDVFTQRLMWTDQQGGGCIASYHLKKLPLRQHAESLTTPESTVIYVGFGPDESDRMERLVKAAAPWQFDFPLTWKPRLGRCDVIDELRRRGLHPPSAYEQGYPHANCRGACILAGIGQWQALLKDDPSTYEHALQKEQVMLAHMRERGRKEVTILRDRRGGVSKNLSLEQLKRETESGERPQDTRWSMSTCSCVGDLWS